MDKEVLNELQSINKKIDTLIGLLSRSTAGVPNHPAVNTGDDIKKRVEEQIAKARRDAMEKINMLGA